jgi:hypothetical protein
MASSASGTGPDAPRLPAVPVKEGEILPPGERAGPAGLAADPVASRPGWRARRRGPRTARAALFRPIGVAFALLILLFGIFGLGTGYYRSWLRHGEYQAAVHHDGSTIGSGVQSALGEDEVDLLIRGDDDTVARHRADRAALGTFVAERLDQLEQERAALKAATSRDADLVLDLAFADAPDRVERYADWFFAWKTSYQMLKESVVAAAHRAVAAGVETWREAVERDLTDYFMRNFSERVLQPEQRNPLVEKGVRNALRHSHDRYLQAIAENDLRLQLFLQEHTRHLDREQLEARVAVNLDWDAQKWKAPLYRADERSFDGLIGVGTVLGSTLGGRALGRSLAPAMQPLVRRTAERVAAQVTLKAGQRAAAAGAGAGAGTSVAPGVGSAVGAMIGLAAGVALDYLGNRVDSWMNRDEFVQENLAAIETIEADWRSAIEQELHRTIDVWFDDSARLLARLKPEPPAASGSDVSS